MSHNVGLSRNRLITVCALVACCLPLVPSRGLAAEAPTTDRAAAVASPAVQGPAATTPATPLATGAPIQIARSALLRVDGTPTSRTLDLRIRRLSDQTLIGTDEVTATIDGHNENVTRVNVDTYQLPIEGFRGDGPHEVEITVAHDGIREILAGKVIVPQPGSSASLLGDHKQVAWWILNIVIVLIAAIAITRRKG